MTRRPSLAPWIAMLATAALALAGCALDEAAPREDATRALVRADPSGGLERLSRADRKEAMRFLEVYAGFISQARTPRATVALGRAMLERAGFVDLEGRNQLEEGDAVFFVPRPRTLAAARVGAPDAPFRVFIVAIDAPHLVLEPSAPHLDTDMVLLETRAWGAIDRKQWLSWPLLLQADYVDEQGVLRSVSVGDDEGEPVFLIPDLLIHLARNAQKDQVVDPEAMNAVAGFAAPGQAASVVLEGFSGRLRAAVGASPEAFATGEFALLPATPPAFVGVDRAMLAAYGHRFRAVLFAALQGLIDARPEVTTVVIAVDRTASGGADNVGYPVIRDVLGELHARLAPEEARDELGLRRRLHGSSAWLTVPIGGEVGRGVVFNARSDDDLPAIRRLTFDTLRGGHLPWQLSTRAGWSPARSIATMGLDVMDFAIPIAGPGAPLELLAASDLFVVRRTVTLLAEAPGH